MADVPANTNLNATEGDDLLAGTSGDDLVYALGGNDSVYGLAGNDVLGGDTGDDQLFGGDGDDTLLGGAGNDTLDGGAGNDLLRGDGGNNTYLFGRGDGQDFLETDYIPEAGQVNTLVFKAGVLASDVVVNGDGGNIVFSIAGGTDQFTVANFYDQYYYGDPRVYSTYSPLQQVQFADGTVWSVDTVLAKLNVATEGPDVISGTAGNDVVNALGGNDYVYGMAGDDVLDGGAGNDVLDGGMGNDTMLGGVGNDNLWGGDGDDALYGGSGDDTLGGGEGNNTMVGGAGDDYYRVALGDVVVELAGEGTDTVASYTSYTLGDTLENLTLEGYDAIDGTGNALDNVLVDNYGDNTLIGGAGNDTLDGSSGWGDKDTLVGGTGDDYYILASTMTVITELAGEGIDTVFSWGDYALGDNVENLVLAGNAVYGTGNDLDNHIDGGSGANALYAGAGNDWINGGGGGDFLYGGSGIDAYYVDDSGAVVIEQAGDGSDTVFASISYSLTDNVEKLVLIGDTAIDGTGNTLDNNLLGNSAANTLTGDAGDDWLDGAAGADAMLGGVGDDLYFVDNSGDVVTELANEGNDKVVSSVSYTLGDNLEKLVLVGDAATDATGNALDNRLDGNRAANTLTGGAGNDWLNGAGGADTLVGGTGNDVYYVDNAADVVTELAGEGHDTVFSSIDYTLGDNLEELVLIGDAAVNATGNALDNLVVGNSANNTLAGGAGNDTYRLDRGFGADTIVENDATAGNTDVVEFGVGVIANQLWFSQSGNDLEVSIIGTNDKFSITDWYLGSAHHVEQFKTSYGQTLLDSQVQNLVQAMAAFAPPAAGQTSLSSDTTSALAPVLAANWH
ncbi:hypothetical protein os1_32520 [Comamonadaceae bacterium OS-1]|nr:hypothetical protein os1_32520 [Comamonadaceae bacterium OS-1]